MEKKCDMQLDYLGMYRCNNKEMTKKCCGSWMMEHGMENASSLELQPFRYNHQNQSQKKSNQPFKIKEKR